MGAPALPGIGAGAGAGAGPEEAPAAAFWLSSGRTRVSGRWVRCCHRSRNSLRSRAVRESEKEECSGPASEELPARQDLTYSREIRPSLSTSKSCTSFAAAPPHFLSCTKRAPTVRRARRARKGDRAHLFANGRTYRAVKEVQLRQHLCKCGQHLSTDKSESQLGSKGARVAAVPARSL